MHTTRAFLIVASFALAAAAQAAEPAAGRQQAGKFNTEFVQKIDMGYLLYLPKDYEAQPSWPLLVFLHGAGERGDDLELVKKHGPPKLVEEGQDLPFIVLSPQCQERGGWQAEALAKLIDEIVAKHKVDADRVYLTGLSMGGFGTFALAAAHPEKFAAIVPICGGGDPKTAEKLRALPTWVFHGAKDRAVPLERSQEMVDALQAAGGNVQFTVYPEAEHDSWTETYANPKLYQWLLAQRRPAATKAAAGQN
jgi:predicted peptidase